MIAYVTKTNCRFHHDKQLNISPAGNDLYKVQLGDRPQRRVYVRDTHMMEWETACIQLHPWTKKIVIQTTRHEDEQVYFKLKKL